VGIDLNLAGGRVGVFGRFRVAAGDRWGEAIPALADQERLAADGGSAEKERWGFLRL